MNITDQNCVAEEQSCWPSEMLTVGHLAGGTAHDVRNQLTVIHGFARMLLDHSMVTDEGKEAVEEILKAAEKSTRLTSQLLALHRGEMLRSEVVDLAETIHDISPSLFAVIDENIRLSIIADSGGCCARMDRDRFQRAITNLVVNARDAMPQGGELVIEVKSVDLGSDIAPSMNDVGPGPYVMVAVSDTGCGMDSKTMRRIYEPFFTTKEAGKGAGLGLPMVYGFVKQCGGSIKVTSIPGRQASFRLYFPRTDSLGDENNFD